MRRLRTESGAEERIAVASRRLFHAVFLLWFSFLFLLTLGKMDRPGQGLLTSLLGTFFALTMFSLFGKKLEALSDRTMGACLALAAAAVFAGCLLLGSRMLIEPFNDTGSVYYSVAEIFETGKISKEINAYTCCEWATYSSNHDYFLIYKNSLFMVWYLYRYFRLLAFFAPQAWSFHAFYTDAGLYACLVLNSLSMTAAMVFGFLTVKKKAGNMASLAFLVLCAGFLPCYLTHIRHIPTRFPCPMSPLPCCFTSVPQTKRESGAGC